MFGGRKRRREAELIDLDRWRVAKRLMDEDVTVLGEELADLHVETLADELDPAARDHYRSALEHYDQAKHLLAASRTADEAAAVERVVADSRFHRAAVIALRDGEPVPQRRDPCFFDPRHGPAMGDVEWAPLGGVPRTIGVCASDARRLAAGDAPIERLVRVGDRWVPWHLSVGAWGVTDAASHYLAQGHVHGRHVQKAMAESYISLPGSMSGFGDSGGGSSSA